MFIRNPLLGSWPNSRLTALPLSSSALGPKCLKCKSEERQQPQHPDTDVRLAEGICESMIWALLGRMVKTFGHAVTDPKGILQLGEPNEVASCCGQIFILLPSRTHCVWVYHGTEGKALPKAWELSAAAG